MSLNCHHYHKEQKFSCNAKGIIIEDQLNTNANPSIIKLFPNPSVNGYFNLDLNKRYEKINVTVNSMLGQTLFYKSYQRLNSKICLDLSSYPSGIYIINIVANGKRLPIRKAIKG